jgi:hypothetical protein
MDEITKAFLFSLLDKYPRAAVRLTHQFLDGNVGKPCGIVPPNWDGKTVTVIGKWWDFDATISTH